MKFLDLIRWKNLCIIAIAQLLVKYALLEPFGAQTALDGFSILVLVLATICIAAGGNIINDIYDIETDRVNKPQKVIVGKHISEKVAFNLFLVFNILGVGLGFYLSNHVNKGAFLAIFIIISVLLYVYSTYLKRTPLIGNIVISVLVALSLIVVGIFDLIPTLSEFNRDTQLLFFKIILDYAMFAFIINLLRELAKDLEDINGDYKAGMNTLPIAIGRERAKYVLVVLNFMPLGLIVHHVVSNLYTEQLAVLYFLLFVIAPSIYVTIKTFQAKAQSDFHHLSNVYKLILFFGMLSLLLYKYVILK